MKTKLSCIDYSFDQNKIHPMIHKDYASNLIYELKENIEQLDNEKYIFLKFYFLCLINIFLMKVLVITKKLFDLKKKHIFIKKNLYNLNDENIQLHENNIKLNYYLKDFDQLKEKV